MHKNETFLQQLTDLEVLQLVMEAELLGKAQLTALKEQLARVNGRVPA